MSFWVTIKKKTLSEEVKKRLNAKLECHLAGSHTLSHEISERDIL